MKPKNLPWARAFVVFFMMHNVFVNRKALNYQSRETLPTIQPRETGTNPISKVKYLKTKEYNWLCLGLLLAFRP
jgi:hypothetical protein